MTHNNSFREGTVPAGVNAVLRSASFDRDSRAMAARMQLQATFWKRPVLPAGAAKVHCMCACWICSAGLWQQAR